VYSGINNYYKQFKNKWNEAKIIKRNIKRFSSLELKCKSGIGKESLLQDKVNL
jgi:hypothetical protein